MLSVVDHLQNPWEENLSATPEPWLTVGNDDFMLYKDGRRLSPPAAARFGDDVRIPTTPPGGNGENNLSVSAEEGEKRPLVLRWVSKQRLMQVGEDPLGPGPGQLAGP